MLKMLMGSDNGKKCIGLGLTHDNLERLRSGKPIIFSLREILSDEIQILTAADEVFLFSGKDENTMLKLIREKTNIGKKMTREIIRDHRTEQQKKEYPI